jgi:hydrogenase nickel incorporation protein HypB
MFESADVIVLNKTDLLPYIDFDKEYFVRGIRALNEEAPIFEVSCRTGAGLEALAGWLRGIL